jgi:hypothetical protein
MDLKKWSHGPEFLSTYMSDWKVPNPDLILAEDDPEVKRSDSEKPKVCCVTTVTEHPLDKLIDKHSSWYRLKRVVAWLLRFRDRLRLRDHDKGNLTVKELHRAELTIIKHVQEQHYAKVKKQLGAGKDAGRDNDLKSLDPFLDEDGLIRVGGRLKKACIEECHKQPYVVPHNSPIAEMIAREKHEISHSGCEWVVSLIRRKFWMTKVRVVVKRVSRNCFKCKKLFSSSCLQKMADLPLERLDACKPPFCHTGLDCFGPFLIKQGRAEIKRYGCVFTCLTTRAVHLEKLNGLDTDTFLNGFRRFISRRGFPETVLSDQGTNFTGACSELSKSLRDLDKDLISRFSVKHGVEWKFNPPGASHMGGAWERLIRSIRKVMAGVLDGHARLNDESLETLFCEIEFILNGRPLTKVSDDVNDSCPLTPNHLLLLRECPTIAPGSFCDTDVFKRRWRCVQHLANVFWHKWLKQYVPELQKRVKWSQTKRNVQTGDLVMIADENTPRGVWPLGLVLSVNRSEDGLVRSVEIKTKSSKLVRPITKVVLLEGVV